MIIMGSGFVIATNRTSMAEALAQSLLRTATTVGVVVHVPEREALPPKFHDHCSFQYGFTRSDTYLPYHSDFTVIVDGADTKIAPRIIQLYYLHLWSAQACNIIGIHFQPNIEGQDIISLIQPIPEVGGAMRKGFIDVYGIFLNGTDITDDRLASAVFQQIQGEQTWPETHSFWGPAQMRNLSFGFPEKKRVL